MSQKLFRITGNDTKRINDLLKMSLLEETSHQPCYKKQPYVISFLYRSPKELKTKIQNVLVKKINTARTKKICILFTGQGSQYPAMAREAYQTSQCIKESLDSYSKGIKKHVEIDLMKCLLDDNDKIHQTEYTQPSIVMLQMALNNLWYKLGIEGDYFIGHSVGEFSALYSHGLYDRDDILKLITKRAKLMQELKVTGGMIAIASNKKIIDEIIEDNHIDLDYAAFNSPTQTVLAGENGEIEAMKKCCQEKRIKARVLNVSHPFHSRLMQPMTEKFKSYYENFKVKNKHTKGVIFSNVYAKELTAAQIRDDYWSKHILKPVNFTDSLHEARKKGAKIFLEIGPDTILTNLAKRTLSDYDDLIFLSSMKKNQTFKEKLLETALMLDNNGHHIEWKQIESLLS
ncbi:MAG: acyltransferase domain-containing protein [Pseudomonadota bacterium]|nr:acyltransferase domain-containing protein [Pseudomonadota bacterium]